MSTHDLPLAQKLYPAGCRVRFMQGARDKVPILAHVAEGLLLKAIEFPERNFSLVVEYPVGGGQWDSHTFEPCDIEMTALDEAHLAQDLVGRTVHFPRSSGIGIKFPAGASDYGLIESAHCHDGIVRFVLRIAVAGTDAPFITFADFSQCDLLPRAAKPSEPGP